MLEALLEVADSGITYRRRYLASLQVAAVVDLLLMDETNPRAIAFQLVALGDHLAQLPRESSRGERGAGQRSAEDRLVLASLSRLRLADVVTLCATDAHERRPALEALLLELARALPALSDALNGSYLNHAVLSRQLAGMPRSEQRP
jgi:uncharacterized alpha-E superfamily protein